MTPRPHQAIVDHQAQRDACKGGVYYDPPPGVTCDK